MSKIIKFTEVNPIEKFEVKQIKKDISKTIDKGDFILGDSVKSFEKDFSNISKVRYAVGCGSGTDALILALMSLKLKEDDEIIVPGMTYISTGLSVILNNNKLVLVDIDQDTGLISMEQIKKKITKKTKAIIPVNLYGQRIDLKKLRKIVGKKIFIIEDSAQSILAFKDNDKKLFQNNLSDMSCYSFYPAKNLGAYGDGGLVATNNFILYKKLLALRNLGSINKNEHFLIGMNSRLDTIQSVVLRKKLKTLLKMNAKRRKIGSIYDKLLKPIKEIKLTKTNKGSSRHLYVIRTKHRNELINFLKKRGISSQMHYPYSLNKLKAFKNKFKKTRLKNSELWAKECLSLPIHPKLKTNELLYIVNQIKRFFNYI